MNKIFTTLLLLLGLCATAQVKIGDNPTTINASAVLETESTTKGFLPPRMTQAQMNAIAAPAAGLIVYCTDCNPAAHYAFDGSTWSVLGSATNPNATFASNSLSCSGTLSGSYVQYTAMNSSNTKTVTIQCNSPGTVTGSTNTVNGVSFSVNTTLYSTGPGTAVTLTASGTPQATGTFSYTATVAGQTCNFNVTYTAAATFNCGTITHTLPTSLVNGSDYNTGSVSLPYTAGTGAAYPTATVESNGLTLTRVAGTYAAGGGTVVYDLSGTYTGTTGSNATFTLPDGGCVVTAGAATYSGPPSCGAPAGNYISTVPMTGSNTVSITVTASSSGTYSITTNTANGVAFGGSGTITAAGTQNITLTASGTPVATGAFNYTVTIGGQSCTFTIIYKSTNGYAVATYNGAMFAVSSGTDISWTNQLVNNNGVSINGSNITLKAGKTYRLTATLQGATSWISYQFVNSSNAKLAGTCIGTAIAYAGSTLLSPVMPADGIYTVGASDEIVKLQILNAGSNGKVGGDGTYILPSVVVEEIGSGFGYAVGTRTSSTNTFTTPTDISWQSLIASSGGVTISGNSITLLAGKTYRLSANLLIGNTGSVNFAFVNSSNAILSGTTSGYGFAIGNVVNNVDQMPAGGVYTVGSSNETVKLRVMNVYNSTSPNVYVDQNAEPCIIVQEMPSDADFGVANITAVTGTLNTGDDINWSSQVASNNVTISGSSITLKAGKTYRLQAILGADMCWMSYHFVKAADGSALTGTKMGISLSPNQNNGFSTYIPAEGIYTVGASDETVKLRIYGGGPAPGGTVHIYGDVNGVESSLIIKEIK